MNHYYTYSINRFLENVIIYDDENNKFKICTLYNGNVVIDTFICSGINELKNKIFSDICEFEMTHNKFFQNEEIKIIQKFKNKILQKIQERIEKLDTKEFLETITKDVCIELTISKYIFEIYVFPGRIYVLHIWNKDKKNK